MSVICILKISFKSADAETFHTHITDISQNVSLKCSSRFRPTAISQYFLYTTSSKLILLTVKRTSSLSIPNSIVNSIVKGV